MSVSSIDLVRQEVIQELDKVEAQLAETEQRAKQGDKVASNALPYIRVMQYKLEELFKSTLTLH